MSTRTGCLYFLTDLADGRIRYVGITTTKPKQRLYSHIHDARSGGRSRRAKWIRALQREGRKPHLVTVADGLDWGELCLLERFFIADLRREGHLGAEITNGTDGGEGTLGRWGESHAQAGLTEAILTEAARRSRNGQTLTAIASELNCSIHALQDAVKGKTWKRLRLEWGDIRANGRRAAASAARIHSRDPAVRARKSEENRRRYADPMERKRTGEASRRYFLNPKNREKKGGLTAEQAAVIGKLKDTLLTPTQVGMLFSTPENNIKQIWAGSRWSIVTGIDPSNPGTAGYMLELEAQALRIASLKSSGMTPSAVAKKYNVSTSFISNIWLGLNWSRVTNIDPDSPGLAQWELERDHRNRQILALKDSGQTQRDVAAEFGVSQGTVSLIWLGKTKVPPAP